MIADDEYAIPELGWKPRPHQKKLWSYLARGGKRAVAIWHRRAGKDEILMRRTAVQALLRPANYWHMLPEFNQARKAVFDAVNPHTGKRRIDECFPPEIRSGMREHDMQITLVNGSTWSCVGSDSVVSGGGIGSSTAGIVFSEFALANPSAWAYYRPILEENNGWAAFISTPRGRNHLLQLYEHARSTPSWFAELLTIDDTGALTPAQIAETKRELINLYGRDAGLANFEQEMMCSFTAAILGGYWTLELADVRREGRISDTIDAIPGLPVHRAWDLGVRDDTSVWQYQVVGGQIYLLNHIAASGVGVEWWRDELERADKEFGWIAGTDYVPHDANVKEFGTGRTRVETMQTLNLNPFRVPLASFQDGIEAVRRMLPLCVFHSRTEETGLLALEQYRREWDDEKKAFRQSDVHDWCSHPAAAMRYLAMSYVPMPPRLVKVPKLDGIIIPPPPDYSGRKGIRL